MGCMRESRNSASDENARHFRRLYQRFSTVGDQRGAGKAVHIDLVYTLYPLSDILDILAVSAQKGKGRPRIDLIDAAETDAQGLCPRFALGLSIGPSAGDSCCYVIPARGMARFNASLEASTSKQNLEAERRSRGDLLGHGVCRAIHVKDLGKG